MLMLKPRAWWLCRCFNPQHGSTPLYAACCNGHMGAVEVLLTHGVDANANAEDGHTPLYGACRNGHAGVVEMLLKHRVDVGSGGGNMPLYAACCNGHVAVVDRLLKHGVDANAKAEDDRTPMYGACCNGRARVVEALLEHGGVDASAKDEVSSILLARLLSFDVDSFCSLHVPSSDLFLISPCLGHATFNDGDQLQAGDTPLHYACTKGHVEVGEVLLTRGVDIQVKNWVSRNWRLLPYVWNLIDFVFLLFLVCMSCVYIGWVKCSSS